MLARVETRIVVANSAVVFGDVADHNQQDHAVYLNCQEKQEVQHTLELCEPHSALPSVPEGIEIVVFLVKLDQRNGGENDKDQHLDRVQD